MNDLSMYIAVIAIVAIMLWFVLWVVVSTAMWAWNWTEDDNSTVYNPILKFIMVKLMGYSVATKSAYMYERLSTSDESDGEPAFFMPIVFVVVAGCFGLLLINLPHLTGLVVGTYLLIIGTRFIKRLSKKINKLAEAEAK